MIAAAADRDEDAARDGRRLAVRVMEKERSAAPLDTLDPRGRDGDARVAPRLLEIGEQRLLGMDLGAERQLPGWRHSRRIGVDRLGLRKIDDGGERLRRLEDGVAQSGGLRLDRGRDPGDAGADDRDVDNLGLGAAAAARREVGFPQDGLDGAGARVGGELQERDAGQVARDADTRHGRRAVLAHLGEALHGPRGPPGVQPARVAGDWVHAGRNCIGLSFTPRARASGHPRVSHRARAARRGPAPRARAPGQPVSPAVDRPADRPGRGPPGARTAPPRQDGSCSSSRAASSSCST